MHLPSMYSGSLQLLHRSAHASLPAEGLPQIVDASGSDGALVCAACRLPVTNAAARIEVDGSHLHTRRNPGGFVYTFGCFAHATGCLSVGEPERELAWFRGYSWQIQSCVGCGVHLGWLFRSPDHRFFGLITARLAQSRDERAS